MFLFDTDTITNIVKPRPSQNLLAKLEQVSKNQQYISTITISEIVYGAEKSQRPEYHLNNLETILLPAVNIVGFDAKSRLMFVAGFAQNLRNAARHSI